jgi:hypothetical protein
LAYLPSVGCFLQKQITLRIYITNGFLDLAFG